MADFGFWTVVADFGFWTQVTDGRFWILDKKILDFGHK